VQSTGVLFCFFSGYVPVMGFVTVGNGFGLFIDGCVLFIAGRYCSRDPVMLPGQCFVRG
jgi:uncharacterized membrane protein YoaK (UPF0700 family)